MCQRPSSRACRSISFPRTGIRPPARRPDSFTRPPGCTRAGDTCSETDAGTRTVSVFEQANDVAVGDARQAAWRIRDGPAGTARTNAPSAAVVVLPRIVADAPVIRSRAIRTTGTPAPAPATLPTIVARPERRVTAVCDVPLKPAATGVVFELTFGSQAASWFAVRTWIGP